jgi:hypothetical protein
MARLGYVPARTRSPRHLQRRLWLRSSPAQPAWCNLAASMRGACARAKTFRSFSSPTFRSFLDVLETDGGREWRLTLPLVVRNLLPKFAQVYRAMADGLVRNEPRCSEFNSFEADAFGALNREPKPRQEESTLTGAAWRRAVGGQASGL